MLHPIEVFTADTPIGIKILIALEEIGAGYTLRMIGLDPATLQRLR